ncbi:PFL_4669 family integrating conjugative element protein [Vibrio parahaemolyticus]|uniref:PFL_4669 family integrating conjugative element protein n=1 Tax=Vibrio parahaemolyticus TaxID=670 RepID=UPI0011237788|nr:TIGR03761 family integrating conjugative element protein [Vibrio parahaemolyticus]TOG88977.1 integrating conjugative element protein [Vibrio parahaemolyticus]
MNKKKIQRKPSGNKIGSLVGRAQIELHSVESARFWNPGSASVVPGASTFFKAMSSLEVAASKDDPYADYGLLEIERAMNEAFALFERIDDELPAKQTSRVQFQDVVSRKPLVMRFVIQSRFGWRLVMVMEQFDLLMVRLYDSNFKTLLRRSDFERYRESASQALRRILSLGAQMKHSGITRQDVATNNAKAQAALKKFGAIPFEVLEGIERAEFAPQIRGTHG